MPYRLKKKPATTNNVTTAIINQLNADGHCARRVNNAGVYDPVKRAFRRTRKDQRGIADILACVRVSSRETRLSSWAGLGLYLAIEVKTGDDVQSADQKTYQEQVEHAGGIYLIVKTYADFTSWYESSIFKPC
jgi:hypothetical protein